MCLKIESSRSSAAKSLHKNVSIDDARSNNRHAGLITDNNSNITPMLCMQILASVLPRCLLFDEISSRIFNKVKGSFNLSDYPFSPPGLYTSENNLYRLDSLHHRFIKCFLVFCPSYETKLRVCSSVVQHSPEFSAFFTPLDITI
jgi:hypothetical protein